MSTNTFVPNPMLEMLMSREQLMEDIIAIVDEYFQAQINECDDMGELSNFEEAKDDLTSVLCDAVCKNFPAKWYSGQLPVENFYSTGQSTCCPLSLDFCLRSCIVYTWTTKHQATTHTSTPSLRWDTIGKTARWSLLLVLMPPILGWSMVGPLTPKNSMKRNWQTTSLDCDSWQGATQNRHSTQNPLL